MNRIRYALLLILLPLLSASVALSGATPPESTPLTLEDAVRIGLEKSRTLEVARLERQMAGEKIRETWSNVLPQVTAALSYTRTLKPSVMMMAPNPIFPTGVLETSSDNAARASIDLRQPLFNGSAFAGIKAASIVRNMSDEAYRSSEAGVISTIKISYFDALIAKEPLKLIQQSIARWEQSKKDTRSMFRQGVAADIDTLKAYLSVENLRPDLIRTTKRVENSMTMLKNAMGLPPETSLLLTGKLEPPSTSSPSDISGAYREALAQRAELRQLDFQVQAEAEKINSVKAENYPVLNAVGKLETQTAFNDAVRVADARWPTSSSVGLQLSMPLFTGYRISSQVEQAKISQLQTRSRLEELKANIRAEVEVRVANVEDSRQRIEVQSRTIGVAERSFAISALRFKEGIGSRLELTDAELQLNTAKTNYLQAVYDNLVATTLLDKALGRRVTK